jgi:hypothetical protein
MPLAVACAIRSACRSGRASTIASSDWLGVQSRSEVEWIVSESAWLACPGFADVFIGRYRHSGKPPRCFRNLVKWAAVVKAAGLKPE